MVMLLQLLSQVFAILVSDGLDIVEVLLLEHLQVFFGQDIVAIPHLL